MMNLIFTKEFLELMAVCRDWVIFTLPYLAIEIGIVLVAMMIYTKIKGDSSAVRKLIRNFRKKVNR